MAIGDLDFRYATDSYETDGIQTDWNISFSGGYISEAHVGAYSVVVDAETGLETDRTEHTLTFLSETVVRITPAVPADRKLYLYRDTPKTDIMVEFVNGKVLNKANLDLANRQAIFGLAEIVDALSAARIEVNQQTGSIIDLSQIIRQVYDDVVALLAAGGIVSVTPRVWTFIFNGEDTDFTMAGADVEHPGFYDTYVSGAGLNPDGEYTVILGDTPATSIMRFSQVYADGVVGFAVLRGYAKPYTGPAPITDLRVPIIDFSGTAYFAGKEYEFALIRCTSDTAVSVNLKEISPTGGSEEMRSGSYLFAHQRGAGQVTFVPETPGVTLVVPGGMLPKTRASGSTISAVCDSADANTWILGGDLASV